MQRIYKEIRSHDSVCLTENIISDVDALDVIATRVNYALSEQKQWRHSEMTIVM